MSDPEVLEATLVALPEGSWVEVYDGRETFRLRRVPGDQLYLPGDTAIHCGDVAWAMPEAVTVLLDEGADPLADARAVRALGDDR